MFAARKGDCSAFVIFQGGASSEYPEWFINFIEDSTYEDEYRRTILIPSMFEERDADKENWPRIWPRLLTEGLDVFLRNAKGGIKRIDIVEFNNRYYTVNNKMAALREDCIEYVYYTTEFDIYPEWFVKEVTDQGVITRVDDYLYYNGGVDYNMVLFNAGEIIFLRNKWGDIRPLSVDEFRRDFFWSRN